MEEAIKQLITRGADTYSEGKTTLTTALNDSSALLEALDVMTTSTDKGVRHCASVLVRRKIVKFSQWRTTPPEYVARIKVGLLAAFVNEPESTVKCSIAQIIATLAKHEFTRNKWPEVETFIYDMYSQSPDKKEHALYLLMIMADISYKIFDGCIKNVVTILDDSINTFSGDPNNVLPYRVVMTYNHLCSSKKGNIHPDISQSVMRNFPIILQVIRLLATADTVQCIGAMELLDILASSQISTLFLDQILELLMEFTLSEPMDVSLRIKATYILGQYIVQKKNSVLKSGKFKKIIQMIFHVMSCKPEDDNNEHYFVHVEEETTVTSAITQMLDMLALHLPPNQLVPPLMAEVTQALNTDNVYAHKASYLILAMIAEGCAGSVRQTGFDEYMNILCRGLAENAPVARNAAFFALGQFAEHLQPEVSNYADRIFPHLVSALTAITVQVKNGCEETKPMEKVFYAIESYITGIGSNNDQCGDMALQPFMQVIIERIFEILNKQNPINIQVLAMEILTAVVSTAKDRILPFLEKIIAKLGEYLNKNYTIDTMPLLLQALDTLSMIWRKVKKEHTSLMWHDTVELAANLAEREKDEMHGEPEVRSAVYSLFSSMSLSLGPMVGPQLPLFMELMLRALRSTQGMIHSFSDEESEEMDKEMESAAEELADGQESIGYEVETVFLAEKEAACAAIKDIAESAEDAFMVYLEDSFLEVYKLVMAPQEGLVESAIDTLAALLIYKFKHSASFDAECHKGMEVSINALSNIVCKEMDHEVVTAALIGLHTILTAALPAYEPLMEPQETEHLASYLPIISQLVCKVLSRDVSSLKTGDIEADSDDEEAESEEYIQESAGELLPLLGRASPGEPFRILLVPIIPFFLKKTTRRSIGRQSYSLGILAECTASLCANPDSTRAVFPTLLNVFTANVNDPTPEVRSNSLYGLGELCYYGKEAFQESDLQQVLALLMQVRLTEKIPNAMDNAIGALSRLILARPEALPLNAMLPVMLEELPLKKDFVENRAVFMCLQRMYDLGVPALHPLLPAIVQVAAHTLHLDQTFSSGTKDLICKLLARIRSDFQTEWAASVSSLPSEVGISLQAAFQI